MVIWLLDVSNHQGDFNLAQAAPEGSSAISCKATEGVAFRDGWFDRYIPAIKNAGRIPGAHHFLRAGSGAEQARVFHSRITAHGAPAGFLCALDNESDASWDTPPPRSSPNGTA